MIRRNLLKAFICILICSMISIVWTDISPVIGNEIAMGQMDHDIVGYLFMQLYNKMPSIIFGLEMIILLGGGISIVTDVIKYFKSKKEKSE